jgi:hypothetical protein
MTYEEAKQLHSGDEVYWNDPDAGVCSRYYRIQSIDVHPDDGPDTVVEIQDIDGSFIECFLKELS